MHEAWNIRQLLLNDHYASFHSISNVVVELWAEVVMFVVRGHPLPSLIEPFQF